MAVGLEVGAEGGCPCADVGEGAAGDVREGLGTGGFVAEDYKVVGERSDYWDRLVSLLYLVGHVDIPF